MSQQEKNLTPDHIELQRQLVLIAEHEAELVRINTQRALLNEKITEHLSKGNWTVNEVSKEILGVAGGAATGTETVATNTQEALLQEKKDAQKKIQDDIEAQKKSLQTKADEIEALRQLIEQEELEEEKRQKELEKKNLPTENAAGDTELKIPQEEAQVIFPPIMNTPGGGFFGGSFNSGSQVIQPPQEELPVIFPPAAEGPIQPPVEQTKTEVENSAIAIALDKNRARETKELEELDRRVYFPRWRALIHFTEWAKKKRELAHKRIDGVQRVLKRQKELSPEKFQEWKESPEGAGLKELFKNGPNPAHWEALCAVPDENPFSLKEEESKEWLKKYYEKALAQSDPDQFKKIWDEEIEAEKQKYERQRAAIREGKNIPEEEEPEPKQAETPFEKKKAALELEKEEALTNAITAMDVIIGGVQIKTLQDLNDMEMAIEGHRSEVLGTKERAYAVRDIIAEYDKKIMELEKNADKFRP